MMIAVSASLVSTVFALGLVAPQSSVPPSDPGQSDPVVTAYETVISEAGFVSDGSVAPSTFDDGNPLNECAGIAAIVLSMGATAAADVAPVESVPELAGREHVTDVRRPDDYSRVPEGGAEVPDLEPAEHVIAAVWSAAEGQDEALATDVAYIGSDESEACLNDAIEQFTAEIMGGDDVPDGAGIDFDVTMDADLGVGDVSSAATYRIELSDGTDTAAISARAAAVQVGNQGFLVVHTLLGPASLELDTAITDDALDAVVDALG